MDEHTLKRFEGKIEIPIGTSCWLWTGAVTRSRSGYGRMHIGSRDKRVVVHRLSYEHFVGPIHEGHELDHLCRVTRRVNPDHLEAVLHQTNVKRGMAGLVCAAIKSAKTHCPSGHEYSGKNLRLVTRKSGKTARQCRKCANNQARNCRARSRQ